MGKFGKEQWKQKQQQQREREQKSLSEAATDPRFQKALSDPKFRHVGAKKHKIKIDDRFKGMFKDPKFQITSKYDARGRKVNRTEGEHLKKFYDVEEEEEEEESEEQVDEDEDVDQDEDDSEDIDEDEDEEDEDDEEEEDQEDNEEFENELLANTARETNAEPVPIGDATYRLAVMNCDWDKLKAVDLFVVFSSFLPSDGIIKSVTVYPSQYGLEQMKKENMHGPEGIFRETVEGESDEDDKPKHVVRDEENDEDGFDEEKLRAYELQRLKYYFAVVECDSVETGQSLYQQTDGTEIESTANIMDVRYIPDDVEFTQQPRDVATSIPVHYKPPLFQTKVLQHTKPECSWDTTDSHRLSVTQANVTNENIHEFEEQYKDYIASTSESESDSNDDENNNQDEIERKREKIRNKYKSLLDLIQPQAKETEEMEITFTPGIKDDDEAQEEEEEILQPVSKKGAANGKAGKPAKKQDSDEEEEEPDSDYDHYDNMVSDEEAKKPKKANKKKKKKLTAEEEKQKAELELMAIPDTLMTGGEAALDDKKKGYNLKTLITQHSGSNRKKRKLKKLGKDQDDFTVDLKDDRFSALFDKPDFAVDPTDKRFKSTKNADIILKERVKRRAEILMKPELAKKNEAPAENNKKNELSSLVESVKKKAQMAQQKQQQNQPPGKKMKFNK